MIIKHLLARDPLGKSPDIHGTHQLLGLVRVLRWLLGLGGLVLEGGAARLALVVVVGRRRGAAVVLVGWVGAALN